MAWLGGWCASEMYSGDVHVHPIADLRDHDLSRDCWCRPRLDDEDLTWVHNSLDRREDYERRGRLH